VDWEGASVGKKEDKKCRSVCLPEPCLHLITAIYSVFSLNPISSSLWRGVLSGLSGDV